MAVSPTQSKEFTGLPQLSAPLANPDLTIAIPWYRFFIALWQKTGGSTIPNTGMTYIALNGTPLNPSYVQVFNLPLGAKVPVLIATLVTTLGRSVTNFGSLLLGTASFVLGLAEKPGGAAQPQTLTTGPFVYSPTIRGTLCVQSGLVELSRDSGVTFYVCSPSGGAIPMCAGDKCRITWYGVGPDNIPTVAFLPSGS